MRVKLWERHKLEPFTTEHYGKELEVNVQRHLRINDVNKALRDQPGIYAWYASLRDDAEKHLRDARHEEYNVQEDLYVEIKAELQTKGAKATETDIKTRVKQNKKMRAAYRERMVWEDRYQRLKTCVDALVEKRWCLQSLSSNMRAERGIPDSA